MSENGLLAQTGNMTQDGNKQIENGDQFLAEVRNLDVKTEELLRIWMGPAASAYHSSYEGKAAELVAFGNKMTERGENIVTASNILSRNEEDLAAQGSGLFRG